MYTTVNDNRTVNDNTTVNDKKSASTILLRIMSPVLISELQQSMVSAPRHP